MTTVRSAVSRNLYRSHDLAARQLEDRVRAVEDDMAGLRAAAARSNGSLFAPPGCIAAEYLIMDLRSQLATYRKAILAHREKMTAISRSVCPLCEAFQARHCDQCGSCSNGRGLSCAALECSTLKSKVASL